MNHPWLEFKVSSAGVSRLHKVREAAAEGRFYQAESSWVSLQLLDHAAVFVVKHDWAAVLGDAVGEDDAYRLPFDLCAFEFEVAGIPMVLMVREMGERHESAILFQARDGSWNGTSEPRAGDNLARMKAFCDAQVRAICVVLESKVAERKLVHAPAALNAKRARSGKPPLVDYHVVDLSRRVHAAAPTTPAATGRQVRLHFRRGHWRHFDTHKTWIEWTLVGNPDLGWVDKEYRI